MGRVGGRGRETGPREKEERAQAPCGCGSWVGRKEKKAKKKERKEKGLNYPETDQMRKEPPVCDQHYYWIQEGGGKGVAHFGRGSGWLMRG